MENVEEEIKLGSRAYLKKTGILAVGTVIGIINSKRFNRINLHKNDPGWGQLYPTWMSEPVVYIEFDKPQRSLSFEEYCAAYTDNEDFVSLPPEEKEFYYNRIPVQYFVVTPLADVEVID